MTVAGGPRSRAHGLTRIVPGCSASDDDQREAAAEGKAHACTWRPKPGEALTTMSCVNNTVASVRMTRSDAELRLPQRSSTSLSDRLPEQHTMIVFPERRSAGVR